MYTDFPDAMFVETKRMASVENLLMRDYQVALWISLDEQLLSHACVKKCCLLAVANVFSFTAVWCRNFSTCITKAFLDWSCMNDFL